MFRIYRKADLQVRGTLSPTGNRNVNRKCQYGMCVFRTTGTLVPHLKKFILGIKKANQDPSRAIGKTPRDNPLGFKKAYAENF